MIFETMAENEQLKADLTEAEAYIRDLEREVKDTNRVRQLEADVQELQAALKRIKSPYTLRRKV